MCANCGCGVPEATQGDERNILWSQVVAAVHGVGGPGLPQAPSSADAAGISPQQAAQNIKDMADQRTA